MSTASTKHAAQHQGKQASKLITSMQASQQAIKQKRLTTPDQQQTHSDIKAGQPASQSSSKQAPQQVQKQQASPPANQQQSTEAIKQPHQQTTSRVAFYMHFSAFWASPLAKENICMNIKYYHAIKSERSPN